MKVFRTYLQYLVAFLIVGSAALLLSCKPDKKGGRVNPETVITMKSGDLTMTVSRNGLKSYRFTTPSLQQYDLASDPYTKYPEGIYVETFQDSTEVVESTIRSDEAIYYQKRKLWMASGNVVATGSGNTLYTEQLFWDEKTDRVFSNVKVRVVDQDGEHLGEGFESDVSFETWVMRDYEGTLVLDTTPNEEGAAADGAEGAESPSATPLPADVENSPQDTGVPPAQPGPRFGEVRALEEPVRSAGADESPLPDQPGQTNGAQ